MSIYFPRIKDYFKDTKFIKFNSILNKLYFDKLDITEEDMFILAKELQFSYTNKEKTKIQILSRHSTTNLSFALGIYVETFYNDSFEDFKEIIIKNIKMRIAPPMVVFPMDFLKKYLDIDNTILNELLLLSVGIEFEKNLLTLINPKNAEYFNIPFDDINNDIFLNGRGIKWIMLNSPNMSKPKFRNKNELLHLSLNSYGKEFLYKNNDIYPIYSYGKHALINWVDSLEDIYENDYLKLQREFENLTKIKFISDSFGREYLANCISTLSDIKEDVEILRKSSKEYQKVCSYILKTSFSSFDFGEFKEKIDAALDFEDEFWNSILKLGSKLND